MISKRKQRQLHEAHLIHILDWAGVRHSRTLRARIRWFVRGLYRRS